MGGRKREISNECCADVLNGSAMLAMLEKPWIIVVVRADERRQIFQVDDRKIMGSPVKGDWFSDCSHYVESPMTLQLHQPNRLNDKKMQSVSQKTFPWTQPGRTAESNYQIASLPRWTSSMKGKQELNSTSRRWIRYLQSRIRNNRGGSHFQIKANVTKRKKPN